MINKIEIENVNELFKRYAGQENILIGVDYLNSDTDHHGADLVIYDTTEMLQQPTDIEDFYSIINENCLYEEDFEIDRYTLAQGDF